MDPRKNTMNHSISRSNDLSTHLPKINTGSVNVGEPPINEQNDLIYYYEIYKHLMERKDPCLLVEYVETLEPLVDNESFWVRLKSSNRNIFIEKTIFTEYLKQFLIENGDRMYWSDKETNTLLDYLKNISKFEIGTQILIQNQVNRYWSNKCDCLHKYITIVRTISNGVEKIFRGNVTMTFMEKIEHDIYTIILNVIKYKVKEVLSINSNEHIDLLGFFEAHSHMPGFYVPLITSNQSGPSCYLITDIKFSVNISDIDFTNEIGNLVLIKRNKERKNIEFKYPDDKVIPTPPSQKSDDSVQIKVPLIKRSEVNTTGSMSISSDDKKDVQKKAQLRRSNRSRHSDNTRSKQSNKDNEKNKYISSQNPKSSSSRTSASKNLTSKSSTSKSSTLKSENIYEHLKSNS